MNTAAEFLSYARQFAILPDRRWDEAAGIIDGDAELSVLFAGSFPDQADTFGQLPLLQARMGGLSMAFFLLQALRLLPKTVAFYEEKGIEPRILQETLSDLDRNVQEYERLTGLFGIGGERYEWIFRHLRCRLFQLGRLQFMASSLPEDTAFGSYVLNAGTVVLETHIYSGEPLMPEDCQKSFDAARRFFPEVLGIHPAGFTCESWLLSPQICALLSPESNICRFAAHYTLSDHIPVDDTFLQYIFWTFHTDYAAFPAHTQLQKAVKAHLLHGGHFDMGYGFAPI